MLDNSIVDFNSNFYLEGQGLSRLLVKQFDRIDYEKVLDITKWDNKKRRLSWMESIQVLIFAYFRAAGSLVVRDQRPSFMKGIKCRSQRYLMRN